jgi:hypothetical protein
MDHYDQLEIRCPRLGHEVAFSYCRQESGDLPCMRILSCWKPFFHVESFLSENMPPSRWQRFIGQAPKEKIITLVDLIDAAKKRRMEKRK